MEFLSGMPVIVARTVLITLFLVVLFIPAWWIAGRLQEEESNPFFRFLCSAGIGLVGYLSFVNLVGRLTGISFTAMGAYITFNVVASVLILYRSRSALDFRPLTCSWRTWIVPFCVAIVLGLPQWLLAVSTNYFDEAASSAIHLTGPNQFAEGLFPPRHNALPYIAIKYHYGSIILAGTVRWLTGLSANTSIDVVSTSLWLFVFLFVFFWLSHLGFRKLEAYWGSFTVLLGGGLSWLYLRRIEAYNGIEKVPPPSALIHRYDASQTWLQNLLAGAGVPSFNLRNADGSLSNLPWDIAAQFQQHAVALGMALTVFAFFLFAVWQKRERLHIPLLVANIVTFSVLFLGHAVFGTVAAASASICLLAFWVKRRTKLAFYQGLVFGLSFPVIALLHGGLLSTGPQYGVGAVTTFRKTLGYSVGGVSGFFHWNIAGFGIPLFLALLAFLLWPTRKTARPRESDVVFLLLAVFAIFSDTIPQLTFYSSETIGVEQFTEISKFFFSAHLATALLSVFGIACISQRWQKVVVGPAAVAMAITPLSFIYAGSFNSAHKWNGFYHSPYYPGSVEETMGKALDSLKHSNRDVYFDASADERHHNYLGELLIFGGSVFTLTPSRYERTGIGYRLSEQVVARRFVQNSRMARLLPGAAGDCHCSWYYSRPYADMALKPPIVRSRFEKAVSEGYFTRRASAPPRALYSIDRSTIDLDQNIERYWRPRVVSQSRRKLNLGRDGNGLLFYDYASRTIIDADRVIELPEWLKGEFAQVSTGSFSADSSQHVVVGRMKDTYFHLGKRLDDLVEQSTWGWTFRGAGNAAWLPEFQQWLWDVDVPFIAAVGNDGFDHQVAYRPQTREWLIVGGSHLAGPVLDPNDLPIPFAGRFFGRSVVDLGLWGLKGGNIVVRDASTGTEKSFNWGGQSDDVLVPGDYDGDGYDEIGVWQRTNSTWYWRKATSDATSKAAFGTATSVPVPADYNNDGRLDLAYWEPGQRKIFVSFTQGRSIDLTISVPPNSIPAFVNMY